MFELSVDFYMYVLSVILIIFLFFFTGMKVFSYRKVKEGIDTGNPQNAENTEENIVENKKYDMLQKSLDDITYNPVGGGRYQASDVSKYQCVLPVLQH